MEIKGFTIVIYLIFTLFFGWVHGSFFLVHGLKIFIEDVYEISMEKMNGKYHIACQISKQIFGHNSRIFHRPASYL